MCRFPMFGSDVYDPKGFLQMLLSENPNCGSRRMWDLAAHGGSAKALA